MHLKPRGHWLQVIISPKDGGKELKGQLTNEPTSLGDTDSWHTHFNNKDAGCLGEEYFVVLVIPSGGM